MEIVVNEESIHLKMLVEVFFRNTNKQRILDLEKIKPDFLSPSELSLASA